MKGIIHPQVVSNWCEFLSSVEHKKGILKNVSKQTISGPLLQILKDDEYPFNTSPQMNTICILPLQTLFQL